MDALARDLSRDLPPSFQTKFTPDDFRYFKMVIHPTARQESKDVTKKILLYLSEKDIVTSVQLQKDLDISEAPILKRLKVFREFKLCKRERNKFYRVTPRLKELVRLYVGLL